jgi:small subunit ribosomal protein S4
VRVDGKRVDRASYAVKPDQEIALDASSPVRELATANTELTPAVAPWLQADFESLSGTVLRLPNRNEVAAPIDEALIVELYSRL